MPVSAASTDKSITQKRRYTATTTLLLCLMSGLCFNSVRADEETKGSPPESDILSQSLELAEQTRDILSEQIVTLSDTIDTFFGSERVVGKQNRSQIRLYTSNTLRQGGVIGNSLKAYLKLDLPRTNDRLSLVIETNSLEQEANKEKDVDQASALPDPVATTTVITSALQYIFKRSEQWNVRASAGLRFKDTLEVVSRLRVRRLLTFDKWEMRLSETLFWYSSEKLGETSRMDLERALTETFYFRATSHATWRQSSDMFELGQYFTMFQDIGHDRYLAYQLSAQGESEPNLRTTAYSANIYFRKMLYKNWIYVDFVPLALFQEENNFELEPSFSINFELVLGATKAMQ